MLNASIERRAKAVNVEGDGIEDDDVRKVIVTNECDEIVKQLKVLESSLRKSSRLRYSKEYVRYLPYLIKH